MNNDSMQKRTTRNRRRSLWSRIVSALSPLTGTPGTEEPPESPPVDVANVESPGVLSDRFTSQLFASLLLELPEHRRAFTSAWLARDRQSLASCTHRLAGAVAYCDLPGLGAALAGLENALRDGDGDEPGLWQAYNRASREIDDLLEKSGLREP
jgi:HPt (histidine-containing phosphotransfer) domain-containing protein